MELVEDEVRSRLARTLEATVRRIGRAELTAAIERLLAAGAPPCENDGALVWPALGQLYESRGMARVANLAARCNLSPRQFERRFRRACGVAPKTLARLIRFEAVRGALLDPACRGVLDLAREFDFADQGHLIRDFKAFAGMPPGAFIAAAIRRHESLLQPVRYRADPTCRATPRRITILGRDEMSGETPAPTSEIAPWRGIHHVALATPDLDATLRFYGEVLGMPVSDVFPSRAGRGRHALVFVKPGDSDTWGIHFFERPEAAGGTAAGPFLHIAFTLPDAAAAQALHARLRDHGIEPDVLEELGGNLFFPDNHGLMVEITWPKEPAG